MEDELSQLDELIESDILDALGEETLTSGDVENIAIEKEDLSTDDIVIEDFIDPESIEKDEEVLSIETKLENEELLEKEWESELEIDKKENSVEEAKSINVNSIDIASLLGELLNNKTIEITIKIKD